MRYSTAFIPTLRNDPADAEVISHRLMLRAGMIRKVAAGLYTYLPLAWRAINKVSAIIREEMEHSGAQELCMPLIQPAELWTETGRWDVYGKELLRVTDRHGRAFCVGPTHEEVITDLVRGEVRSYKDLPLNLYQIQTKFRDEIRPRFGLMRGREFIMKDGYSFDADEAGAERTYRQMEAAYHRIFSRLGLTFRAVEADSGQIGGSFSHEFMVLADTGEDDVVFCDHCNYAANSEKATSAVAPPPHRDTPPLEPMDTPGVHTVEDVAQFLATTPDRLIKTLIFRQQSGASARFFAVLIRGDREVNEVKLGNLVGGTESVALAANHEILKLTGGPVGFSGPLGLTGVTFLVDHSVRGLTDAVTGANASERHLAHVLPGRDFPVTATVDVDTAQPGDHCPRCADGHLAVRRGIEVGHIFMLGTRYSEKMNASFLDPDGKSRPFIMGCYGIGVGRTVASAIEQRHDDKGIIWPMAIAPYQVTLICMNMKSDALREAAETCYRQMQDAGIEVLYDERDERAGVKLTDAELLGMPLTVILGERGLKAGIAEVRERQTGATREVPLASLCTELSGMIRGALNV